MHLTIMKQVNNAVSIQRGPLLYALNIKQSERNLKDFPVKGFLKLKLSLHRLELWLIIVQ